MEAFVVRIWSPAEDDGADGAPSVLQGVVEHVRSARSRPFRDEEQLLRVLRTGRRSFAPPAPADPATAAIDGTGRAARSEGGRS